MPGPGYGRTTRRWRRISANQRAKRLPCCYCGQPIDYELHANHPSAFTVAHRLSVRDHPELAEDPTNIRGSAHRACNAQAGADEDQGLGLGITSGLGR